MAVLMELVVVEGIMVVEVEDHRTA